jgi:N-acetylneuraminate synthase
MVAAPRIAIGDRRLGEGQPCFVIAEAGVNHNGDVALAQRLVDAAAEAGADAVKFQTFVADRLAAPAAAMAAYQRAATGAEGSQVEMLRRLELSADAHRELAAHCRDRGILFLSTPFDEDSADLLESLGVPAFKLPSGELTNLPLLAHVARKGRTMLVSTGMATLEEVRAAVRAIRAAGDPPLALLHCVSSYPADPADANLRAMRTLAEAFGVPIGYSDHTPGIEVALAAVALGACVLEKHLTLDRALPGPDHRASLEPAAWRELVVGIRRVEAARGDGRKVPPPRVAPVAAAARRSLVAADDIPAGTRLTEDLVTLRRPGTGLPHTMRAALLGRTAVRDIPEGTVLTLELFE